MAENGYPKLRAVQSQWVEMGDGKPVLLLQDRLGLGAGAVVVPQALAPMLTFCDGTRSPAGIKAALELYSGLRLDLPTIEAALRQLDSALLLDNGNYAEAHRRAVEKYRAAPFRAATLAGTGYPEDPDRLRAVLDGYLEAVASEDGRSEGAQGVRGLICPHIDFERGGGVYARLWGRAREAVAEADEFVIVGTDHGGGPAEITLTRQSFATPFGILRTDVDAVDYVAEAMGEEAAFRSELNHVVEHSIELASVWLHHAVGSREVRIVPVLCGSFQPFSEGNGRPGDLASWRAAASALREIARRERTLVIAAADLAHVGPAFGGPRPIGEMEKGELAAFDAQMLACIATGDAEAFLGLLVRERDRFNVCGLPPIYLAMTMLGSLQGKLVAYSQCPAPPRSVVSVAGMLLCEGEQRDPGAP